MEAIREVLSSINEFLAALNINSMYVLLWVAAGYIQKIYFSWFKLSEAYKTLILGSVFSIVYALLWRNAVEKATWHEFLVSYIFATSLYELFLKDIVSWVLISAKSIFKNKLQPNEH